MSNLIGYDEFADPANITRNVIDFDSLIDRIVNSNLRPQNIPGTHCSNEGLLCHLGIDIGRLDYLTYTSFIQTIFDDDQERILTPRLGIRDGIALTNNEQNTFSNFTMDVPRIRQILRRIMLHYWEEANNRVLNLLNFINTSHSQTMLISWLYDYGFVNARKFERLINVLTTNDRCKIAKFMWDEHEATDSLYWKSNRKSDIAFLLGDRLDITVLDPSSSVDQFVLDELNFANLTEFQNKIGLDVGAITQNNYNLSYIWLTSRNAPSWETITKLDGSPADLISSTKQFIEDSRLRLQRLLESKIYAEDEIPSFELELTSIDSDGMSLEIALPYTTTNSDDLRCDVPGYDRDATELLLMALVNDKRVRNISQIRLRDPNLANKGLCTLVGERRGSTPTFEEDYQLGNWATEATLS